MWEKVGSLWLFERSRSELGLRKKSSKLFIHSIKFFFIFWIIPQVNDFLLSKSMNYTIKRLKQWNIMAIVNFLWSSKMSTLSTLNFTVRMEYNILLEEMVVSMVMACKNVLKGLHLFVFQKISWWKYCWYVFFKYKKLDFFFQTVLRIIYARSIFNFSCRFILPWWAEKVRN